MARIFYSMAGEGRGHATRARALVEMLRGQHEITLFAPAMAYALLSKAYAHSDVRVRRLAGLRFHYRNQTLSYTKSLFASLAYVKRLPWMLRSLERRLSRERPDLCITDFEPLLPRAAAKVGIPLVSFDHQHFLAVSDFSDLPFSLRVKAEALGQAIRWFYAGQRATIVSSFHSLALKPGHRNVHAIGNLLRPEVLRAVPTDAGHLLVYLRRFPHRRILSALQTIDREVIIYGLGEAPRQGNMQFRPIDEESFLADLASAHALITNAGNQLVGEAYYLRKPILAIPEPGNFEQEINAFYVQKANAGMSIAAKQLTPDLLHRFLAGVEQMREQIQPERVRGNEMAAKLIEAHLPSSMPADSAAVTRVKGKKQTSIPARLLGFARGVFARGQSRNPQPRFLTYTVTFSCNAKCVMCDSWKMPSPDDLTLDEISAIFDELPALDAVRLTGGEPFVRADFPQIAELAERKLHPLLLHITTNGFLTKRIVSFCENRSRRIPLHLLVSVDGVGEKHNQIRGSSIAWRSVMETIEAIAPKQKQWNIHLAVNQTIVDAEGVEHYKLLRDILRPLGVRNNVVMAYDTSATYNLERDIDVAPTEIGQFTTFGNFSEDHFAELAREIERDLHQFPLIDRLAKRYYLRGIRERLLAKRGTPNPPCTALHQHLRLFPNGDVPTCQFNSKIAGNLRRQSFRDVWRSAAAQSQRAWVRACPGCWAECEVLPSAIYSLDLLKESLSARQPSRIQAAAAAVRQ